MSVDCVLAVGNALRGDDGAGVFAGKVLEKKGFLVLFGHESPENLLSRLKTFDRIFVLDSCEFGSERPFVVSRPGSLEKTGYSHNISLGLLQKFLGKKMVIVGIKTYKRTLGSNITPEAKSNALKAVKAVEMCMAVPGVVVDVANKLVKVNEQEKKVKFSIPGLKEGDFVLVHSGVVVEKLSKEEYEDACDSGEACHCDSSGE